MVFLTLSPMYSSERAAPAPFRRKLNTLVKDPYGRNHEVLKRFVAAGAPEEIIYQQKPHLGTDVLVGIVEKMRHEIEEMGGKFCFRSKVTDLIFENNTLKEIEINNDKRIPAQVCVLAPGHSARDTFEMLQKRGVIWSQSHLQWGCVLNILRK